MANATSRGNTRGDGVTYAESFGYDLLNHATSETCSNAGICGTARSFGYDDFGSLTSKPGISNIVLATMRSAPACNEATALVTQLPTEELPALIHLFDPMHLHL